MTLSNGLKMKKHMYSIIQVGILQNVILNYEGHSISNVILIIFLFENITKV